MKRIKLCKRRQRFAWYSAAIRGGLIEAGRIKMPSLFFFCIPPRFAAASLKQEFQERGLGGVAMYSAAIRGGLIEAKSASDRHSGRWWYSAAIRGGLIEATDDDEIDDHCCWYSAAIRGGLIEATVPVRSPSGKTSYSAAIRGGLIEARIRTSVWHSNSGIPPRFAAASLKPKHVDQHPRVVAVFRRDSRRPH